ncbi:MAG: EAL domain-containing protein [Vicinamibacterales bacterium]
MTTVAPSVLFVDDDAQVLAGIAVTLRHRAFRVLTARSAREGLECLDNDTVSVVVSDEHMPDMGGTAFLTEVQRRHPGTVRIVLSGSANPQVIARAVNQAGLFRYLLKPCTPSDLTLAVEQGIEAQAMHRFHRSPSSVALDLDEVIDHFLFHMQPIFSAAGQLLAHEALLRLPPRFSAGVADVLAAAEHDNRIWEVDRAIRTAVSRLIPSRPASTSVFVNLHPCALLDPQIYTSRDPLAPYAQAVVLEITERGSLAEIDDLAGRVRALRDIGYRVAIDDMGSGYSGLTTFTSLLPDFVKFDRELTSGMHASPAKRQLVSSIAAVCGSFGIATVAEGIEDRDDLQAAREVGCTYLQGYLLGRPACEYVENGIVPLVTALSGSVLST